MRPPIVACGWMFERKCGADYASSRTGWCTRQDGRMAGWQDGDCSCRVYEQNHKFAKMERQDREKKEADNKAGQGCSVTRPKDEEPIPSTHCDTRTSSVQSPNLHAIQVSQLVPQQRDVCEVHDGSPCDDNGGAGLGSYHKRKSCIISCIM